jgi:hypothetical protein
MNPGTTIIPRASTTLAPFVAALRTSALEPDERDAIAVDSDRVGPWARRIAGPHAGVHDDERWGRHGSECLSGERQWWQLVRSPRVRRCSSPEGTPHPSIVAVSPLPDTD